MCFNKTDCDLVIAADGGYDYLKKSVIEADILIGDFDSITAVPDGKEIIRHPVEKDDTDSFLAYKLGLEKGYRTFVVLGGIGGRLDHTIANIQMLCNMAKNHSRGFLVGDGTVISVIDNSAIRFTKDNNGNFGVFAHNTSANGVTIKGAKYNLQNSTITPEYPVGVSNEFIGTEASVSVTDGQLLLIWYENQKEFFERINTYMEE